jgi:hypothetical protein
MQGSRTEAIDLARSFHVGELVWNAARHDAALADLGQIETVDPDGLVIRWLAGNREDYPDGDQRPGSIASLHSFDRRIRAAQGRLERLLERRELAIATLISPEQQLAAHRPKDWDDEETRRFAVGDLVYVRYQARRVGVVEDLGSPSRNSQVRWVGGRETWYHWGILQGFNVLRPFDALIATHELACRHLLDQRDRAHQAFARLARAGGRA